MKDVSLNVYIFKAPAIQYYKLAILCKTFVHGDKNYLGILVVENNLVSWLKSCCYKEVMRGGERWGQENE